MSVLVFERRSSWYWPFNSETVRGVLRVTTIGIALRQFYYNYTKKYITKNKKDNKHEGSNNAVQEWSGWQASVDPCGSVSTPEGDGQSLE